MRNFIKLIETLEWQEAIQEQDWKEALDLSKTPEEIAEVLHTFNAEKKTFKSGITIFIIENDIIEWNGKDLYPEVENKNDWIYDADLDEYFPDYEDIFNRDFWRSPDELYHQTTKEYDDIIQTQGLKPANKTRGLFNRSIGRAIFATRNYEETLEGHYGDVVFQINMQQMKQDGYTPYVSQEPQIVQTELRNQLAHYIGYDDFEDDTPSDISEETVIIYDAIPAKYLTKLD